MPKRPPTDFIKSCARQMRNDPDVSDPRRLCAWIWYHHLTQAQKRDLVKRFEKDISTRSNKSATQRYKEFHGRMPRSNTRFNFYVPKKLIILGRAHSLTYEADKWNGGGDGTLALYRHEFDPGATVCMDDRGKKQLYILGPEIKVTDAGIEH